MWSPLCTKNTTPISDEMWSALCPLLNEETLIARQFTPVTKCGAPYAQKIEHPLVTKCGVPYAPVTK